MKTNELQEILTEGCIGITPSLFCEDCFRSALESRTGVKALMAVLNRRLVSAGFVRLPGLVKWRGQARRIWIRPGTLPAGQDWTPAAIREALDGFGEEQRVEDALALYEVKRALSFLLWRGKFHTPCKKSKYSTSAVKLLEVVTFALFDLERGLAQGQPGFSDPEIEQRWWASHADVLAKIRAHSLIIEKC